MTGRRRRPLKAKSLALILIPLVFVGIAAASGPSGRPAAAVKTGAAIRLVATTGSMSARVTAVRDLGHSSLYVLKTEQGPLCGTSDGAPVAAIPLAGSWSARGAWNSGGLTMACVDGAIGKCVVWGYRPWEAGMRDLHQACVRMVRADYCGDGVGHTRDGTAIDVWDAKGILVREDVPGMTLEAEWGPDGATRIWRTRYPAAIDHVRRFCPHRFGSGTDTAPLLANASRPTSGSQGHRGDPRVAGNR